MPHSLQRLLVVSAGPGRVADEARGEQPVPGERRGQAQVLGPPVGGMTGHLGQREREAAVPLDRAAQPAGPVLDRGRSVAGIQDQGLDVSGDLTVDASVGLRRAEQLYDDYLAERRKETGP